MDIFRKGLLILCMLIVPCMLLAQQKPKLDEAILYETDSYTPERLKDLQWLYAEPFFSYTTGDSIAIEHIKGEKHKSVSLYELNHPKNVHTFIPGDTIDPINPFGEDPLQEVPEITWMGLRNFYFTHQNTYYAYNMKAKVLKRVMHFPKEAKDRNFDPHTYRLAYTIGKQLYIKDRDSEVYQVTADGEADYVNGQSIYGDYFGQEQGTFWSSGGRRLAFYQIETPKPELRASIDTTEKKKAQNIPVKKMNIGLFDMETKQTSYLEEPIEVPYRVNISWGPEDYYLYITEINREQNELWVNEFDAESGKFTRRLLHEKYENQIGPLHPLVFVPGNKFYNKKFLWLSSRDGNAHFYRYKVDGELLNQVTFGNWDVKELLGFSGDAITVAASSNQGLGTQLYKCWLRYERVVQLTKKPGVHNAVLSTNGRHILDQFTSLQNPGLLTIMDEHGERVRKVLKSKDPWEGRPRPEVRLVQVKAADGETTLNGRLVMPTQFEKGKKYPVLIFLGADVEEQLIQNDWLGTVGLWMHYMADQGYIIFTLDERGTANRGLEFDQQNYGHLGEVEMQDQLKGVQYLLTQPFVDADRIALIGKEFGGYLAIRLMINYPEQFTTAVAGKPIIDWQYYDSIFSQRYYGVYEQNQQEYQASSLLKKCQKLRGPLQILMYKEEDPLQEKVMQMFLNDCQSEYVQVNYVNPESVDRFGITLEALQFIIKHNKARGKPSVVMH